MTTLSEADEFASRFPEEVRTLLTMLRMPNLGGLAIAECDDLTLRASLLDYFRRRLEADRIYTYSFEVGPKDINLARSLMELTEGARFKNLELTGKYQSVIFFVYGVEKFTPEQRNQFVRLLNFLRDRLAKLKQAIVIWGSSAFVAELSRHAPDFWSWKGQLYRFPSSAPLGATSEETTQTDYNHLPPTERYLRQLMDDPDFTVWQDLYVPLKASRAGEALNPFTPRHKLTFAELKQLAPLFPKAYTVSADTILMRRGDRSRDCFIIVKGEVEVSVLDALGNDIVVSRLGKGDFFGEIGLIKDVPRTATIRTAETTKLLKITPASLVKIKAQAPEVHQILVEIAEKRLERRLAAPQQYSPLRRFALEGASLLPGNPIDVRELITNDRKVIVLGEAGGGKTTVLRRILLDYASKARHALQQKRSVVLPVFIQLNTLTPEKTIEHRLVELFEAYEITEYSQIATIREILCGDNQANTNIQSLLFLLDGLNEMPFPEQTIPALNTFIQQYDDHHQFMLSCRVEDYASIQGFRTALLQRLSGQDIEAFLVNYLTAEQGA